MSEQPAVSGTSNVSTSPPEQQNVANNQQMASTKDVIVFGRSLGCQYAPISDGAKVSIPPSQQCKVFSSPKYPKMYGYVCIEFENEESATCKAFIGPGSYIVVANEQGETEHVVFLCCARENKKATVMLVRNLESNDIFEMAVTSFRGFDRGGDDAEAEAAVLMLRNELLPKGKYVSDLFATFSAQLKVLTERNRTFCFH